MNNVEVSNSPSTLNNSIEAALNWRYAVKKFDADRKISAADWHTLVSALIKAPSSYGMQPWKFLVVEDMGLREKLRAVSWNQSQVTDASHFVVFLSKEAITLEDVQRNVEHTALVRDITPASLQGLKDMLVANLIDGMPVEKTLAWTQRQAYIAMGFLLETAALLKVDSVPMEGLDPASYDQILGLQGSGWKAVAAVALGYRHSDDRFAALKKVRYPIESLIEYR